MAGPTHLKTQSWKHTGIAENLECRSGFHNMLCAFPYVYVRWQLFSFLSLITELWLKAVMRRSRRVISSLIWTCIIDARQNKNKKTVSLWQSTPTASKMLYYVCFERSVIDFVFEKRIYFCGGNWTEENWKWDYFNLFEKRDY